jgi:hypothetical protein
MRIGMATAATMATSRIHTRILAFEGFRWGVLVLAVVLTGGFRSVSGSRACREEGF